MVLILAGMAVFSNINGGEYSQHEHIRLLSEIGIRFFLGYALAEVLCIVGVLMMWRIRKWGYYLYVVGCAGTVGVPYYLLMDTIDFPWVNLIASGIAVGMFSLFLPKFLKGRKKDKDEDDEEFTENEPEQLSRLERTSEA